VVLAGLVGTCASWWIFGGCLGVWMGRRGGAGMRLGEGGWMGCWYVDRNTASFGSCDEIESTLVMRV